MDKPFKTLTRENHYHFFDKVCDSGDFRNENPKKQGNPHISMDAHAEE